MDRDATFKTVDGKRRRKCCSSSSDEKQSFLSNGMKEAFLDHVNFTHVRISSCHEWITVIFKCEYIIMSMVMRKARCEF